jgi:hypothetical protein
MKEEDGIGVFLSRLNQFFLFACMQIRTYTQKSEPWTTTYLAYVDWTKLFLVSFSHCIRLSIGDLDVEMVLEYWRQLLFSL